LTPQYLNTPGQVGFSPEGTQLIVTTKDNGSDIDVFGVKANGRLSAAPVVNASAEPVPFGFVFDPDGRLVVTEAGGADVSTYGLDADGTLTHASTVADGQSAPCWIASVGGWYYVANAGSADIAGYQVSSGGVASLISANGGIAGTTDAGPIDLAGSSNGQFLYVDAGGAGAVDEFSVNGNGTLTSLGSITGLSGTGIEGIVAS
jgi:DNA-binding beta-propeller fold protein YncE